MDSPRRSAPPSPPASPPGRQAGGETVPPHELRRLEAVARSDDHLADLISRRRAGHPLQYLEGTTQFGPLELAVDGRALIPRPETEVLWEDAVRSLGEAGPGTVIVDLCTGSGNLALALKHAFPQSQVYATDVDAAALSLAKENGAATGLDVTFLEGDLFAALPRKLMGRIDLLVANPPYVAEPEAAGLPVDVRDHEPRQALVAGPTGLETLKAIAEEAFWWLGIGGWLFVEIGETQSEQVMEFFGGLDREIRRDLTGRDRYLAARRDASCCL